MQTRNEDGTWDEKFTDGELVEAVVETDEPKTPNIAEYLGVHRNAPRSRLERLERLGIVKSIDGAERDGGDSRATYWEVTENA